MTAFDFPSPPVADGTEVTNEATGVTYRFDASASCWVVVSTSLVNAVDDQITALNAEVARLDGEVTTALSERNTLLNDAANKNNQQDASIIELDARVDALAASTGKLEVKGRYTYVLEKTTEACTEAYAQCLLAAAGDPLAASDCNRLKDECDAAISDPYPAGSFTSKGTTNIIADIDEFLITTVDANGQTIDWLNSTEEGDYLEFFDETDGDTALFEIVDEPSTFNAEQTIRVKFINQTGVGDGKFNLQQTYDIRVFKTAQGINLGEADARYVSKPYVVYFTDNAADITPVHSSGELRNGELWYDTSRLEMFVRNNNAWVAITPSPSEDVVIASALDDISRISGDVASLSQDVMTIENFLETRKTIYYSDDSPTPVGPDGVTSTLKNGDIWVDSNDLELKFYSQNAWINPDRTVELPKHHHFEPATLRWKFTTDDSTTAPPAGYFKRDKNKRWRFSFKTHDGVDLGIDVIDDTDTHAWDTQMTVWYPQGTDKWKMKAHYKLSEWRWNYDKAGVGHAEFKQSSVYGRLLSNGLVYYVSVGGWW